MKKLSTTLFIAFFMAFGSLNASSSTTNLTNTASIISLSIQDDVAETDSLGFHQELKKRFI